MNTAFYELAITDHFGFHIQCYPHFNILFILEGHASVLFYKESWAVKKNDIIYFKPYEIHQIVNASQNFKAEMCIRDSCSTLLYRYTDFNCCAQTE